MVLQIIKKIAIILTVAIVCQSSAYASEVALYNVVINNTAEYLTADLKLENVFSSKMKEAAFTGLPITFTFIIVLYQVRDFWFDKEIINMKTEHMIRYNILKKEFVIEKSWEIGKTLTTESFDRAQKLVTEISNLEILPRKRLEHGKYYQLAVKAKLSKENLPFRLKFALFFSSLWDFETDWYTLDFNY